MEAPAEAGVSCRGRPEAISRYLDDALEPRARAALLDHLADCPACAALLARYRQQETLLARLPTSPAPANLRARILAAARPARWTPWRPLFAGALLGICLAGAARGLLTPGPAAPPPGVASPVAASAAAALQRAASDPALRALLPGYLPRGAVLDRISVAAGGEGTARGAWIEAEYRTPDGRALRVVRSPRQRSLASVRRVAPPPAAPDLSPLPRRVQLAGRVWRVERLPASEASGAADGEPPLALVLTSPRGEEVRVEGAVPLDELMLVAESLR